MSPSSTISVLRVPSEVSHATLEAFRRLLEPHLEGSAAAVVLDLGDLTFISSTGLSQLVHAGRRLKERGARLALAGASRSVQRLLRAVGLDSLMPHYPSVEEARAHLGGASPASPGAPTA